MIQFLFCIITYLPYKKEYERKKTEFVIVVYRNGKTVVL